MNVWIDSDAGFDNLRGILLARAHGLEIVGLSLVFGNSSTSRASRNANTKSVVFGWNFPILEGAVFFFQPSGYFTFILPVWRG